MFLLRKPTEQQMEAFIGAQQDKPFSYGPIGLTCNPSGCGYNIDHNRVELGRGTDCFQAAVAAMQQWKMFDLDWVTIYRNNTPIERGSIVAVVVRHLGFWSLNACRIVDVCAGTGDQKKYGFAYGTLADHAERGEERFTVEWNPGDDSVWYDILAVSRPGLFASLGYPYARRMQKRFAADSKNAMLKAVTKASV